MNKISMSYKGLLVLLSCCLLGVAILRKVLVPSYYLRNNFKSAQSELVQKRSKLSLIDNLGTEEYSKKEYSEIQALILLSINSDSKVNVTRFSEIKEIEDTEFIDFDFTISGSQSSLLTWLNKFENKFKDAIVISSQMESVRSKDELFLTVYLRSKKI